MTPTGSVPEELDIEIPAQGTPEFEHWRKTGALELQDDEKPKPKEPVAESATATEATPEEVEEGGEPKPAAPPESARPPQKKNAETRIKELLAERKELQKKWEDDRRKWDDERRALLTPRQTEVPKSAETATAKPEEKKKVRARPQPGDLDDKGKPLYAKWQDYEAAFQEYAFAEAADRAEERAKTVVEDRLKASEEGRTASEQDKIWTQNFNARSNEARKKYVDYNQVALNPELPIVHGSELEQYLLESEMGAEMAYYLGQHPDEITQMTGWTYMGRNAQGQPQFTRIHNGLPPRQLFRTLALLEVELSPDEEPAPAAKTSAKPAISAAPKPPHQISGKTPPTVDEEEVAVNSDDETSFLAYQKAANAKEIARRKSRR